jgi:hypothetical protein
MSEDAMRREVYTVVPHGAEWAVCAEGQKLLTMASREAAEAAAREATLALAGIGTVNAFARRDPATVRPPRVRETA